jgi:lipoprotein-anchoring transpeptidase ErfK/SrfK
MLASFGCGDAKQSETTVASSPGASAEALAVAPAPSSSTSASPSVDVAPGEASELPAVALDGAYRPPSSTPEGAGSERGGAVAARAMLVPVYERPSTKSKPLGWLRAGAVVALRRGEAEPSGDCTGGFRAIEPGGFVCVGDKATLDLTDPIVRATSRRPDFSQKLPYMYGTATRGGPVYGRLPSAADIARHEPSFDKHIAKWEADEESGARYGLDVWQKWRGEPLPPALEAFKEKRSDPPPNIPFYLRDGGRVPDLSGKADGDAAKIDQIDRRQGAAFLDTFLWEGRRYNVTTDLRLVPADRLRPIRGSEHHGVLIGTDVAFPFALVRRPGAKRYAVDGKKLVEKAGLPYRAAVQLTGTQKMFGGVLHYETAEKDWISDRFASRIDPAKRMPKWGKNGEKWIDVNISKQVLVAYEGENAVFATLVSTGEDGLAEGAKATKKGIFRIHTKYVTTTMDSDVVGEEFELRDVPYVQYFEGGLALHGAYWHDRFGQPKSHGCINLAPEDARRLFFWTEPRVPRAWHGAAKALTGTVVFIHP